MRQYEKFAGLEPNDVLRRFCDISDVPRAPGQMQAVSEFLLNRLRASGIEAVRDDHYNVIARVPATAGYENAPCVMLQAHMDMVCEKTPESTHDFSADPIELRVQNGRVSANQTTLGADDGLGVAMALAVAEDEMLPHPKLELVFTADEETDMNGALALDFSSFESKLLIGLDSAAIQVCGAGETHFTVHIPTARVEAPAASGYRICVDKMDGGHSGTQATIEPGNAVILLNRTLLALNDLLPYALHSVQGGGNTATAFARNASCEVSFDEKDLPAVEALLQKLEKQFRDELLPRSQQLTLTIAPQALTRPALLESVKRQLNLALMLIPDGLVSIYQPEPGGMGCCANIGVLYTTDDEICMVTALRSQNAAKKTYLLQKARAVCALLNITGEVTRDLPQWDRRIDEGFFSLVRSIYTDSPMTISEGTVEAGIFLEKIPGASYIALGAPYFNEHSPREYFDISELQISYERLRRLLAELKTFTLGQLS